MIINKINSWLTDNAGHQDARLVFQIEKLTGFAFQRQFLDAKEDTKAGKLYMSQAGKCARQIAYGYHGIEKNGKEIDSRANIVFWQGDMAELMLIQLAKVAGCNIVASGFDQIRVEMPIKTVEIVKEDKKIEYQTISSSGYADGLLLQDKKVYLVECKSYSSYAYDRFEKGDIDDSYLAQINMYLDAHGLQTCVMVAMNKDNGVLGERIIEKDETIVEACKENLLGVINSTIEKLPERKYQPNEKGAYPWNCLYCGWYGVCLPEAEKVLVSNRWQLRKKKETSKETL